MIKLKNKHKRAVIKVDVDNKLVIDGEISFITIPKLRIIGCEFISSHQKPVFDLQQATTKDISGLALLTAWTRFAKKIGKSIQFINLPPQLLDMAKLNGLKDLLPIG
jgi:phospholipid transport system transporter-binding protein